MLRIHRHVLRFGEIWNKSWRSKESGTNRGDQRKVEIGRNRVKIEIEKMGGNEILDIEKC